MNISPDAIRAHCRLADIRMKGFTDPGIVPESGWYGLYMARADGGSTLVVHALRSGEIYHHIYAAPFRPTETTPWRDADIPDSCLIHLHKYMVAHRDDIG